MTNMHEAQFDRVMGELDINVGQSAGLKSNRALLFWAERIRPHVFARVTVCRRQVS